MINTYLKTVKNYFVIGIAAIVLFCCSSCNYLFPVDNHDYEFSILQSEVELIMGKSVKLTTDSTNSVVWVSLDDEIATVEEDGTVTGVSMGETIVIAFSNGAQAECAVSVIHDPDTWKEGYVMVWGDEFDGNALDMTKWNYQLGTYDVYGQSKGPSNWGNNELQSYQRENVTLEDGTLVINARKEAEKVDGKSYTSGRLTTRGNFTTLYGYVEARIKMPAVSGMWPAFWMLPQPTSTEASGNVYGGWARNGEIDIMEARGRIPSEIDTTLHFGDNMPKNVYKSQKAYLDTPITEWHTYALDWQKEYIAWLVDGQETYRLTYKQWWTAAVSSEENPYAPFDQPFYILLNLAVGGTYDTTGAADIKANEDFVSASMYVDYVRVYKPVN